MDYVKLADHTKAVEPVARMIEDYIDPLLFDIHCMLLSPVPKLDNGGAYFFSIPIIIFALIGGVSKVFYNPASKNNEVGKNFKGLLKDYYPWKLEPEGKWEKQKSIDLLYSEFRNELEHNLGLPQKKIIRPRPNALIKQKFGVTKENLHKIETAFLEWPSVLESPTFTLTDNVNIVHLEGLYWGLRHMIMTLSDPKNLPSESYEYIYDRLSVDDEIRGKLVGSAKAKAKQ